MPMPSLEIYDGDPPISHLARGRIDVWLIRLDSPFYRQAAGFEDLLDPWELERYRRFRNEKAALQHLMGRVLVRTTLSRYVDVPPAAWRFVVNAFGCPSIATPSGTGLTFNLSHTAGLVACAVTRGMDVGVDVERVRRHADIEKLARHSFAPAETASILAAPSEERHELFFAYWTLKESYIKARGMGLALPLDGFAFDISQPSPRVSFTEKCPDDPGRWAFFRERPTLEHRLALAVSGGGAPCVSYRWAVRCGSALFPRP